MASHVMTPARRAALRKAQLASAAKRRRGGVGSAAKRAVSQRSQYAGASANLAVRRHVGSKGFQQRAKKGLKYTAIGLGAAGVIAAGAHGTAYNRAYQHNSQAKMARQMSRKLPGSHPVSKRLAKSAMYHQKAAAKITKRYGL